MAKPAVPACLPADLRVLVLTGPSMAPTLRDGELLELVPWNGAPPRRGDVAAFRLPGSGRTVVHRIVAAGPEGVRTRGDGNGENDPELVPPAELLGLVQAVWRGGRRRNVPGGAAGVVAGRFARVRGRADRFLRRVLHTAYLGLSKVFPPLVPPGLRPRVVLFESPTSARLKLVSAGRTIGSYDSVRQEWTIQRPFRLFVDEGRLPHPIRLS